MKLRVLIADDERLSRERLRRFLHAEPATELVAECENGVEAVQLIGEKSPDLVFLDVRMPELDGLGVVQALDGARSPAIIFVTAHDRFAVRAFEANAVDYLLKPFNRERFQTALQRARERLQRGVLAQTNRTLLKLLSETTRQVKPLERVTINSHGRMLVLKTADIDWICAADNYVELHVGDATYLLRMAIAVLASQLAPDQFVRISRSSIVNVERIKAIRPKSHGDYAVSLHNGTTLSGTRNHRQQLARVMGRAR